jgi:hypothetical protein
MDIKYTDDLRRFENNLKKKIQSKKKKSLLDLYQEKFNTQLIKAITENGNTILYFDNGRKFNIKKLFKYYKRNVC